MAITHTFTFGWSRGSDSLSKQVAVTNQGEDNRDIAVPANSVNEQVAIDWVNAQLKGIYIVSDQDVTLKTNSTGAPDTTINLLANIPLVWHPSNYMTNPFIAADVTTVYLTNATNNVANVSIRSISDATP